jgi:hypothetical protein
MPMPKSPRPRCPDPWRWTRASRSCRAAWIATAFTTLFCAGCAGDATDGDLALDPATEWRAGELEIASPVRFDPTPPMREALARGVDLQIDVVTRVSRRLGPVAWLVERRRHPIRIRFLPLTEQWEMEAAGRRETFPRLWLLLDALEQPRRFGTGFSRDRAGDGDWQIQVRATFDRGALPSPMHLPSLLSPQWRLASPWHTWRIDAS